MFTTRPTLQGTFGMVSSTHWLASQSAMAVLESGGNAYDAAVAAGFVLHVVEPHLNGPGGEVPIIVAPADGDVQVLCGQGVAPAGATIAHYRGLGLDLVPGTGPLAAAVPGAFDAWMLLLRDHGTKRLADVLTYAIGYAEDGHAPVERVGETVETVRELFETEWTSSADVYLPGGQAPRPGELFRNPALAATWKRLLAEVAGAGDRITQIEAAREVWRTGFIAEALVRQSARPTLDTSGEHHTGTLTATDLASWSATYEVPATYDWRGWTLCKAGPWSQGPVFLQQLALLPPELPAYESADYVHLLIEGCKLAMADREAWYGDAAGAGGAADVPLGDLLSDTYNAARRALIGDKASYELRPGGPGGRTPRISEHARVVTVDEPGSAQLGPASRRSRRGPPTRPCPRCPASRPSVPTGSPGATPVTSTSSTAGATWSRPHPAAAGSSPTRSCPSSASRSVPGSRWPGWTRGCPAPSLPAAVPGPPSRPPSHCATGCRSWRSVRPAGTSRTSGSCTSSWRSPCARTYAAAWTSRARSTPRTGTTTASPVRSTRAACARGASPWSPARHAG